MKIFKALAAGFYRTLKAWKGILLIWFGSLLTVSLVAIPMKGFLKSALGGSMITEKLRDGIDFEVFGDLGSGFRNLIASFPSGLLLLVLLGILLNAFLSGGIFDTLKGSSPKFTGNDFFKACAKNFWSFLVISLIISAILSVLFILLFILPIALVAQSDSGSESAPYITAVISFALFFFVSLIFILTADYARAWQAANDKSACFSAIGYGFSRTFSKFLSSFPTMLILVAVQMLFTFLVFAIMGRWTPDTGGGVFLLFIISQIAFYTKSGLKVWRYGSVTSLKEINDLMKEEVAPPVSQNFQA
ncbi:MAG: hypothetical protein NT092_12560 [Bacteroidia bacterium]|nr:hypothetical protein [Bacteroidia bacterium]